MIDSRQWNGEGRRRSVRQGLVLLALAIAVLVAAAASLQQLAVGMAVIAVAVGASVLLKRPPLGILLLVGLSFLFPFAIGTGTGTELNLTVLGLAGLVGLLVLQMVTGQVALPRLASRPALVALLAFVGIACLAFVLGQLRWFPIDPAPMWSQLGQLAVFVLLPGVVLFMERHIHEEKWLRRITWLFLGVGSLQLSLLFLPPLRLALAPILRTGQSGSLFWVWIVALGFGQACFNDELPKVWRVVLGIVTVGTLYFALVINFDWASGWLPSLIAIAGVLWAARPRFAVVVTVLFVLVGAYLAQDLLDIVLSGEQYSAVTRLEAWRSITEMTLQRDPLLGFGPANYRFYTVIKPILGWQVQYNSHNQYVDLLAQTGILGTAAFLWASVAIGLDVWRMRGHARFSGFLRAFNYSLFGGLAGMLAAGMLADWVLPYVYNITLSGIPTAVLGWIFLGGAFSLHHIAYGPGKDGLQPDRSPRPSL